MVHNVQITHTTYMHIKGNDIEHDFTHSLYTLQKVVSLRTMFRDEWLPRFGLLLLYNSGSHIPLNESLCFQKTVDQQSSQLQHKYYIIDYNIRIS